MKRKKLTGPHRHRCPLLLVSRTEEQHALPNLDALPCLHHSLLTKATRSDAAAPTWRRKQNIIETNQLKVDIEWINCKCEVGTHMVPE